MVTGAIRRAASPRDSQSGFTYLWVLVAVTLIGIGLGATSEVWVTSDRRARLAQADWAGAQYAQAIGSYYELSPGGARAFPATFDELIVDRRTPVVRRHLRSLYRNPFDAQGRWEVVRGGDSRIRGVRLLLPVDAEPRERTYVYSPSR